MKSQGNTKGKQNQQSGTLDTDLPGRSEKGLENALANGNGHKYGIYKRLDRMGYEVTVEGDIVPGGSGGGGGTGDTGGDRGNGTGENIPREIGIYYYHGDHLGSSNVITDRRGRSYEHIEYFPYGETWVDEQRNQTNLPYRFTGKELDPETGMYYYGARYYEPRISMWISPDPALWKYLPTSRQLLAKKKKFVPENILPGFGGIYNPINLCVFAHAHLNPVKLIDPDGRWAEDVHSGIGKANYGTYTWAKQVGFSSKDAEMIALGNHRTDSGSYSGWLPILGTQSRHFNQGYLFSEKIKDTREYWAEVEFSKAVKYWKAGKHEAALKHLGKGLHSLQDKEAHRDWDTGVLGLETHPEWYDDWNDPRNKEAATKIENISKEYLQKFYKFIRNYEKEQQDK